MFLRLQGEGRRYFTGTWMLFTNRDKSGLLRLERITPCTTPQRSPWFSSGEELMPVTVNPFLRTSCISPPNPRSWEDRLQIPDSIRLGRVITVESSLLDTYVSDPPCEFAWVKAKFCPSRSGPGTPEFLLCSYKIRSVRPLTVRRAFERPDNSTKVDMEWRSDATGRVHIEGSLGEILRSLETEHHCQFVLRARETLIRLDNHDGVPLLRIPGEPVPNAVARTVGVRRDYIVEGNPR
jgi:hypothetical protein